MSDASTISLSRQVGLMRQVEVIANNIANASTPGFKAEGAIFAEHVERAGPNRPSRSVGHLAAHATDFSAGSLLKTGGSLDLAIEGEGFFKVVAEDGARLTRAGAFTIGPEGMVVDPAGRALTDGGGSPLEIPAEARQIAISRDGTLSVDGEPLSDVGVFLPEGEPSRDGGNYWIAENDTAVENPVILQGFVEQSNVSPVEEFAALIATQRLFEAGQELSSQEHDRLQRLIEAIRRGN